MGPWRDRSFLGFLITPHMEIFPLIDKRPPLNKFLKVRLLPASTEEVYFVPPGGHIDLYPER